MSSNVTRGKLWNTDFRQLALAGIGQRRLGDQKSSGIQAGFFGPAQTENDN
jgi:hypothetical protein